MSDARATNVAELPAKPTSGRPSPVFGTIALVFAVGTLFFPRFLAALPIVVSISLAVASFFRRERANALPILALVIAFGMVEIANPQTESQSSAAALLDLEENKETGGSLHSQFQFVCYDEEDALRGEEVPGANNDRTDAVRTALIGERRCALTGSNTTYDMTADGKERFTTPHGVVELWAAP